MFMTFWRRVSHQRGTLSWCRLQQSRRCMSVDTEIPPNESQNHSDRTHIHEELHTESDKAVKLRVLRAAIQFVPQHGWSKTALSLGAEAEGLPTVAHGLFPKEGIELVHFFYKDCNERLRHQMEREHQEVEAGEKAKKVNVFVKDSVVTRLKMVTPHINTWPQAMGMMTLPQNSVDSLTLLSQLMDDIWFYAGDKSTDWNWYTKRMTLAAVYKSTELFMLQDSSENLNETWKFLDRRLKNVAFFGKTKNQVETARTDWSNLLMGAYITGKNMLGMNDRNR